MNSLFLNKYQPRYFNDFETDSEMIEILNTLISIDNLNLLFIGDIGCGKTAFLNAVIREYYKNSHSLNTSLNTPLYEDNILHINSLKEQGINYYRTDVKIFCQTCSNIKGKKKFVVLDDIDLSNLRAIKHEYGHTIQSLYLGWFYLFIVGVPSIIRASIWNHYKLEDKRYYEGFPENWADLLGEVNKIE